MVQFIKTDHREIEETWAGCVTILKESQTGVKWERCEEDQRFSALSNTCYESSWKKTWQWTLYYCGSLAALSSLKKQIHCDSASVFFLALCLWKNRPQQKPIFAFREMSCLISLYQSISGIQWGSSSVDILSLGFRWYLAFKNPIETLTDLKKKHTQIKIHEHFSGQLQLTNKRSLK